jgi:hypothetical protein
VVVPRISAVQGGLDGGHGAFGGPFLAGVDLDQRGASVWRSAVHDHPDGSHDHGQFSDISTEN